MSILYELHIHDAQVMRFGLSARIFSNEAPSERGKADYERASKTKGLGGSRMLCARHLRVIGWVWKALSLELMRRNVLLQRESAGLRC